MIAHLDVQASSVLTKWRDWVASKHLVNHVDVSLPGSGGLLDGTRGGAVVVPEALHCRVDRFVLFIGTHAP